jgi:hypothetical protein
MNQASCECEKILSEDMDSDSLNKIVQDYRKATSNMTESAKKTLKSAASRARAIAAIEAEATDTNQERSPLPKARETSSNESSSAGKEEKRCLLDICEDVYLLDGGHVTGSQGDSSEGSCNARTERMMCDSRVKRERTCF